MKISILVLCILIPLSNAALSQAQKLSAGEFTAELRQALMSDNEQLTASLIKNNRLFVKPFVDGLIRESITNETEGRQKDSEILVKYAKQTATVFEKTFGEKSLTIGVDYLAGWNLDEKREKTEADSIFDLGNKYRANDPEKAKGLYNQAGTLYNVISDRRGIAEILGGLGLIYFNSGDYNTSLEYYLKALKAREAVDDRLLAGNSHNSIGIIYLNYLPDYEKALFHLGKAESIRLELGDSVALGRTIHAKASAYEKSNMYREAILYFTRSAEINSSAGNEGFLAEALYHSGTLHRNIGNFNESLALLRQALEIYRKLDDKPGTAESLNQLGYVYVSLGDYDNAIKIISEAAELLKEGNFAIELAGIYNHLGLVLQKAGRYERALEYLNASLKVYEESENVDNTLVLLSNIGTLYFDMQDYNKAELFFSDALRGSLRIKDMDMEARSRLNLANTQNRLLKLDEATENYRLTQVISEQLHNPDITWKILVGQAENYELRGENDKAIILNDSALKAIDNIRNSLDSKELKSSYIAAERYIFDYIINLLVMLDRKEPGKGYDEQAFKYSEQSKSRVLLDLLAESQELKEGNTLTLSLEAAQALCPDKNVVLLDYFAGDSSSCMWVITQTGHNLYILPDRRILQEKIETVRFAIQDIEQSQTEFFAEAAKSLYEMLIKPAEPFLKKNSTIVIIPDGILNYLPFEVLLTESKTKKPAVNYSELPFLIKKHPVSYAQSVSVLSSILSSRPASTDNEMSDKKLLAIGDPVYEQPGSVTIKGRPYARLVYSGEEVRNIASLFKADNSEMYLRDNATEENFRKALTAGDYNYVHFATHGYINEDEPDLSGLVLTKSESSSDDGLLQSAEIFDLKLRTGLVVLSACQTGLGKLVRGEGIVGLSRAFMYAGAPSVLVSLWSVSDNSTAVLMEEFYRNLIKSGLYKTDALRKAQLSLLSSEKFAHPFYWAPFVLFGDWK